MNKIHVYQPTITDLEKQYVNDCLDSSWISSKGNYISKFEKAFGKFVGTQYSTAVTNGTSALHLAMLGLGIKERDEVIVPTLTYIASVNAIKYVGATPVFVDSLYNTWAMDPEDIRKKITPRTKAIMVVHLYGNCCDMDKIVDICREFNLRLIEDCAEALGSYYKNAHVGTYGDVSTFSFYGNKTLTTGEGGMVCSNNPKIMEKVIHLKGQAVDPKLEYYHDEIGYNYRMTNICAAIGLAQLSNLENVLRKKRKIARWYKKYLDPRVCKFQEDTEHSINSHWMITVLVVNNQAALKIFLNDNNIETRNIFIPINTLPSYDTKQKFPNAERLSKFGINLPSYPDLSKAQVKYIAKTINTFYDR